MDRDLTQARTIARIKARAFVTAAAAIVVCAQLSCGGGSSSNSGGGGGGAPQKTFTTIDAPNAGTASEQGTFIEDINAAGDAAGFYTDSSGAYHGFIRSSAGELTIIDVPAAGSGAPGLGTTISSIDSAGDTVGYYNPQQGSSQSFLRTSDGTITTFDPPNYTGSIAAAINDNGTIAGGILQTNSNALGYVRAANGTFAVFNPTGLPTLLRTVMPTQINASGATAGYYVDPLGTEHGFLLAANGNVTILDAPGAGTSSGEGTELADINASATIVGGVEVGVINGVATTHSLMRTADGTWTVFDPPQADGVSSFAFGINDSGAIVGTYRGTDLVRHAYLLEPDGTFVSFDEPQADQGPLTDMYVGTEPRRINASGAVAGYYSDVNRVRHGFLWQ
jgi:hypothetical protein